MATHDCIFCKIADGAFQTQFAYESDDVVAFDDISPRAKTHVLVIPRAHVPSVQAFQPEHDGVWAEMLRAVQTIARERGVDATGYRIVSNAGPHSGQEVDHIHIHLLGGEPLGDMC